ncbi:hypothetical protein L0Z16_19385 [Burkholderia multivorans]|uniref:hypothetical protein n=1 Tax=Burkholderia multivorans TaxID=87883 RepID=UPI0020198483|nr:hypothetical protein [Burkholderia multivorans]MCL4661389.1 hypothetical protein [Burkholderia multivorans]MCO1352820.1 hypothetical protein [Burkholderia multivorans]MCO1413334.1 hypothetical protein [Burkholderia multivorans]MCO1446475.1 hypothetical protein [Burkholderia multivorans]UQP46887.1 hypothetical protein L0Z16_19385 [Burkholderia multivorans]
MKITDLPEFGGALGAGLFGGVYMLNAVQYALAVAPKSYEKTGVVVADGAAMNGAKSYEDGFANTVSLASSAAGVAAEIRAITLPDSADLYIPSRDELATIMINVSGYPSSALAVGADEGFDAVPYLTSTALGTALLWNQNPYYGWQAQDSINEPMRVRPIWRIALEEV